MPVSKKQNRALSLGRPWFSFPRLCSPIKYTHGHVVQAWGFIVPRALGKSCPASTRPYRTAVSLPLFGHGFSAELGMTHLNHTEWENPKYRKRDFLIWCGSDNVRINNI
ncbi:hypothetical protein GOBAR_AA29380 [Gossypium barbadense]|uniref:Uncharacterized protein n=1 Tax=Gossypium barbadense TaxID=3634 RepID=A0A2P5WJT0_GOSBA|nr:hypothetical protein GOBAR_AA29380 [Gossypium barbadense]